MENDSKIEKYTPEEATARNAAMANVVKEVTRGAEVERDRAEARRAKEEDMAFNFQNNAKVKVKGVPSAGVRLHDEEPEYKGLIDRRKRQKEQEEITPKGIVEAQEAYDLTPAETKKGGLISYVKGLVEKIKGMFGR